MALFKMALEEGIFSWASILIITMISVGIWIVIEIKRFKHKIFAMLLIALVIFGYASFIIVTQNNDIDFTSVVGISEATKIYFSWMSSIFENLKTITSNAFKLDWSADEII